MRLLVHVEGQTEETFVNLVLGSHLASVGYSNVAARLIGRAGARRHRGGALPWQTVRDGILNHLKGDREAIATTMVDYYGMPPAWPGRTAAEALPPKDRAPFLQDAVADDIRQHMGGGFDRHRFIPYVSMHEFEALLFSDCQRFAESVGHPNLASEMEAVLARFGDPEAIDDSQATAPSKRIIQLLPSYQKVAMGATAAEDIGLAVIRQRCANFAQWLAQLEAVPS